MDFFNCISLPNAVHVLQTALSGIEVSDEFVTLDKSLDRITVKNIISRESLPPFSRSTVDGFAICSMDTFGASEGIPALIRLKEEIFMGQPVEWELLSGMAAAIPTGGMLPKGADAVVMIEHTEQPDKETILINKTVVPGENVIVKGEDVAEGKVIVPKGTKITPQDIGMLAACGYSEIPVYKRPVVGVLSSGDEIVDVNRKPTLGQIRDINSYALSALMEEQGCQVKRYGIVPDRYEELLNRLDSAIHECEVVLVSGGSSVGIRDYTVRAINALGSPGVLLHGITMRPGKPTIFGMVGNVPVFGLPGHPVAAITICYQMVSMAIKSITGQLNLPRIKVKARFLRSVASAPGRDDFIRVQLYKQNNEYVAEPILGKSGLMSTLVAANGIVHIESNQSGIYADDMVEVELLRNSSRKEENS